MRCGQLRPVVLILLAVLTSVKAKSTSQLYLIEIEDDKSAEIEHEKNHQQNLKQVADEWGMDYADESGSEIEEGEAPGTTEDSSDSSNNEVKGTGEKTLDLESSSWMNLVKNGGDLQITSADNIWSFKGSPDGQSVTLDGDTITKDNWDSVMGGGEVTSGKLKLTGSGKMEGFAINGKKPFAQNFSVKVRRVKSRKRISSTKTEISAPAKTLKVTVRLAGNGSIIISGHLIPKQVFARVIRGARHEVAPGILLAGNGSGIVTINNKEIPVLSKMGAKMMSNSTSSEAAEHGGKSQELTKDQGLSQRGGSNGGWTVVGHEGNESSSKGHHGPETSKDLHHSTMQGEADEPARDEDEDAGYEKGEGESCQAMEQCQGSQICTEEGVCEAIGCEEDKACEEKSKLPVRCAVIPPLQGFCSAKECSSQEDCNKKPGYGCFEHHYCKPTHGDCYSSCDCVEKYGMKQGEAKCHEGKCYCRTEGVTECKGVGEPQEGVAPCASTAAPTVMTTTTTTPVTCATPEPTTTTTTTSTTSTDASTGRRYSESTLAPQGGSATTAPTPKGKTYGECPPPPDMTVGLQGAPCRLHQACFTDNGLVCVLKEGQPEGKCEEIKCSSDSDCEKSGSILPLKCMGEYCKPKPCDDSSSKSVCPPGYGCSESGQCRKVFGTCKYDCDCGVCPEIECFKNGCFCNDDFDMCTTAMGYTSYASSNSSSETAAKDAGNSPRECEDDENQQSHKSCPSGFKSTRSGCYKLVTTKQSFDDATAACTHQKAKLAEIDSLIAMEEIRANIMTSEKMAWIGAKKTDDAFKWLTGPMDGFVNSDWDRTDPGECLVINDGKWENKDCSEDQAAICQLNSEESRRRNKKRRRNRRL